MISLVPRLGDYLRHIIDAIGRITGCVATVDHAAFVADAKTQDSVIRNLQIIGEAANNVRQRFPDVVSADPSVPGQSAYGMCNALTHGYFSVDLERVWTTIQNDLPAFEATFVACWPAIPEPATALARSSLVVHAGLWQILVFALVWSGLENGLGASVLASVLRAG